MVSVLQSFIGAGFPWNRWVGLSKHANYRRRSLRLICVSIVTVGLTVCLVAIGECASGGSLLVRNAYGQNCTLMTPRPAAVHVEGHHELRSERWCRRFYHTTTISKEDSRLRQKKLLFTLGYLLIIPL